MFNLKVSQNFTLRKMVMREIKLKKAKHTNTIERWWNFGIHFLFPEFSKFPIIDIDIDIYCYPGIKIKYTNQNIFNQYLGKEKKSFTKSSLVIPKCSKRPHQNHLRHLFKKIQISRTQRPIQLEFPWGEPRNLEF